MLRTKKVKLILLAFLIITIIVAAQLLGIRDNFSISYIKQLFISNLIIGSLSFVLLFCVANIINIPGWIFLVAAILSLGKLYGGLLTYGAAVTSCMVSFLLVDYLGENALRDIKNKFMVKTLKKLDESPIVSVIILRLVFQTFPPLNYALALSGISTKRYFIGTILGLPIPILIYSLFFNLLFGKYL